MLEEITILQIVTISIASIGAVLGIINTWYNLDKSRVKLQVSPAHAIPIGFINQNLKFCIEITNLSTFPITISSAGIMYYGTKDRSVIIDPVFPDGGHWPRRLESRTSVTVYCKIPQSIPGHRIKCAFAQTQCGVKKTGNSAALKQIAKGYGS